MENSLEKVNHKQPICRLIYIRLCKGIKELFQMVIMLFTAFLHEVVPYLYVIGAAAIYMALIMRHVLGGSIC